MTEQEAIETLRELNENYFCDGFDEANESILMAIESLEKQMNDMWVPVDNGKNLPDKPGTYIGTVRFNDGSAGSYPVYFHDGIRTDILWEMDRHEANVIAWRPVPEKYKEKNNGE